MKIEDENLNLHNLNILKNNVTKTEGYLKSLDDMLNYIKKEIYNQTRTLDLALIELRRFINN